MRCTPLIAPQSRLLGAIRSDNAIFRGPGNLSLAMSFKLTSRHLQCIRDGLAAAVPFRPEPSAIHAREKDRKEKEKRKKKKNAILINTPSDPEINIYFPIFRTRWKIFLTLSFDSFRFPFSSGLCFAVSQPVIYASNSCIINFEFTTV